MSSDRARTQRQRSARPASRWPFGSAVVVVVVGLVVTGALTWVGWTQYTKNEERLLKLRATMLGLC